MLKAFWPMCRKIEESYVSNMEVWDCPSIHSMVMAGEQRRPGETKPLLALDLVSSMPGSLGVLSKMVPAGQP